MLIVQHKVNHAELLEKTNTVIDFAYNDFPGLHLNSYKKPPMIYLEK